MDSGKFLKSVSFNVKSASDVTILNHLKSAKQNKTTKHFF